MTYSKPLFIIVGQAPGQAPGLRRPLRPPLLVAASLLCEATLNGIGAKGASGVVSLARNLLVNPYAY